jgi:hypothetical protein
VVEDHLSLCKNPVIPGISGFVSTLVTLAASVPVEVLRRASVSPLAMLEVGLFEQSQNQKSFVFKHLVASFGIFTLFARPQNSCGASFGRRQNSIAHPNGPVNSYRAGLTQDHGC